MILSKNILKDITTENVSVPKEESFDLPEKVLQFGTGRLLRGLPDYYINKANKEGVFNGRIVAVKSTSKGDVSSYINQDYLYTVCEREIRDGKMMERDSISSAISRIIVANEEWSEVLKCAHDANLNVIISNTTEVGIQLVHDDDINGDPPQSFPGKLLAFLYERYIFFKGSHNSGMVIIPTELITDNGLQLKSIVIKLAEINHLEIEFIDWVKNSNHFCSSLVDRIVSIPTEGNRKSFEEKLGYEDDLMTITELYSLWAIEGDENIKEILSFYKSDPGVVITPNIELYRELKLRLLNGPHTLTCGVAFLANYPTVQSVMEDEHGFSFISQLMRKELGPSIPYDVEERVVSDFIDQILVRFKNPYMNHYWINITLNYSSKMRERCIPLLTTYYKNHNSVPLIFSLSFSAYLFFMKAVKQENGNYYGKHNGEFYLIEDERAKDYYVLWENNSPEELVDKVLKNKSLWGMDLSALKGFQETVSENLIDIINKGMKETIMDSGF